MILSLLLIIWPIVLLRMVCNQPKGKVRTVSLPNVLEER